MEAAAGPTRASIAWLVLALVGIWIVLVPAASAASLPRLAGWDVDAAAAPAARDRSEAWARVWNGDVQQVMSTRSDDGFVETLVLLDVAAPLPREVLEEPAAARGWLERRVQATFGATASLPADAVELVPRPEPNVSILRGRIEFDGGVAMLAVAPTGAHHLALILVFARGEDVLYASMFDRATDALTDLHGPVAPFARYSLRLLAYFAWLAVAAVLGVLWTRHCLPSPGARTAGRQVAVLLLGITVLVAVIAGTSLGDASVELALAGTTPWGMAMELALGGVVSAVAVVLATELWDQRRIPVVASAPRQGSFAMAGPAGDPPWPSTSSGPEAELRIPPLTRADPRRRPHVHGTSEDRGPRYRDELPGLAAVDATKTERPLTGADDGPASLVDAQELTPRTREGSPLVAAGPSSGAPRSRSGRSSQSDLFPRAELDRVPTKSDTHPALDAPLPPRKGS